MWLGFNLNLLGEQPARRRLTAIEQERGLRPCAGRWLAMRGCAGCQKWRLRGLRGFLGALVTAEDEDMAICENCGAAFEAKRAHARLCSVRCRMAVSGPEV